MKAVVCEKYGPPDQIELAEVEKPVPGEDEVLVRVQAASVNAGDLEVMRGAWSARFEGPFKPGHKILGTDVAGRVEAVGGQVKKFQLGDEVWGDLSFPYGFGSFAEYVSVSENALAPKPASMSFEEATTYPHSAIICLQNLRDKGQIQAGQRVLINGAGGGMGTFAVQLAKFYGAEVTAVDRSEKFDMLRKIGADHFIDYTQEDYTKTGQRYDLILDVVAYRSVFDYRRALAPDGIFIIIGGSFSAFIQVVLLGPFISRAGNSKISLNKWDANNGEDLDFLAELFKKGQVAPVIDRIYPLSEAREAFCYVDEGRAQGKAVLTMQPDNQSQTNN